MATQIEVKCVTDDIAENIKQLSKVGKALKSSQLNQRAQVILLQEAIGAKYISRDQIRYVLDELPRLENNYLK